MVSRSTLAVVGLHAFNPFYLYQHLSFITEMTRVAQQDAYRVTPYEPH